MLESLACRYRPKTFEEVVSQDVIVKILKQQLATGEFSHAYLFCGPSGDGKTTLARIFAKELNNGCGTPIELDAASNNGVDNVRDIVESSRQRALDSEYKVIIIDECFTGDTYINTSEGSKKIKDILPGDQVMTLTGFNKVTQVHCKEVENSMLNLVRLSDGRTITTTSEHLFLTTNGWVESKNLVRGDILLDAKNMPKLWKSISNETQESKILQQQMSNGVSEQNQGKGFDSKELSYLWENLLCGKTKQSKKDLLSAVQGKINIAIREDNSELRIWNGTKETIIYKDDQSKSDEEARKYRQNVINERIEWNSSSVEREKRGKWMVYRTSVDALECIRRFLDIRVFNKDSLLREQSKQICFIIQSRPWLSREENCNRGGWQFTSLEKEYCSRYKENYLSESVRVESVEIYQPRNNGESQLSATKDTRLYDLTIENSPTYFANGVLVHNCHAITSQGWQAFLKGIEEPSMYTVFIFCTTDPQKIPSTILNRVMRFNLSRIPADKIKQRLMYICQQECFTNCEESCDYIAKLSAGGMRDAIAMLEKCAGYNKDLSINNVMQSLGNFSYEVFMDLTNALVDRDQASALRIIEDCFNNGGDLKLFIEQYLDFVLDLNKYCIFKDISLTKIPTSLEEVQGSSRCVKYVVGIENNTQYFNKLMSNIFDIKNSLKYDTMPKVTISVGLVNICRGL